MHRIGAEQAVEVTWGRPIDFGVDRGTSFDQTPLCILSQHQAVNAPSRVLESSLDSMQPKKPKRPVRACIYGGRFMALSFRPGRRTRAAVGKPGEALFLAPRFTEMIFWQDTSRSGYGPGFLPIQRIWL
jgi:hypothetical protein